MKDISMKELIDNIEDYSVEEVHEYCKTHNTGLVLRAGKVERDDYQGRAEE